jgi:hypothetical protein
MLFTCMHGYRVYSHKHPIVNPIYMHASKTVGIQLQIRQKCCLAYRGHWARAGSI